MTQRKIYCVHSMLGLDAVLSVRGYIVGSVGLEMIKCKLCGAHWQQYNNDGTEAAPPKVVIGYFED